MSVYISDGELKTGLPAILLTAQPLTISQGMNLVLLGPNYVDIDHRHITAYMNANLTTWAQANKTIPRNSLYDGCSG